MKAEAEARAELLQMKSRSGATGMVSEAVGMLRAALAHQAAGDATGAIDLAATAVELAPQSGVAHLMPARVYFDVDPTSPGRVLEALRTGLLLAADDPRSARPLVADLFATVLTALVRSPPRWCWCCSCGARATSSTTSTSSSPGPPRAGRPAALAVLLLSTAGGVSHGRGAVAAGALRRHRPLPVGARAGGGRWC